MKTTHILVTAAALILAACSSTPIDNTSKSAPAPAVAAEATSKSAVANVAPAKQDSAIPTDMPKSVYFDFDVYTIKAQFTGMVEQNAKFLKAHPELALRLEGNADERGGREYNLALGQKRAEAVKRALQTQGVNAAQVEAVSFGKEKPKAEGDTEAAWAENRRADIVYITN
jgi:peptidoglycan-associated lipoprotein